MPVLNSFFCCGSLEIGGTILGWYGVVKSVIVTIVAAVLLSRHDQLNLNSDLDIHLILSIMIGIFVINLIACIMLIIGTVNKKPLLMLPWLITNMVAIISYAAAHIALPLATGIAAGLIFIALNVYLWLCVFALYQHLTNPDVLPKYTRNNIKDWTLPAYSRQSN